MDGINLKVNMSYGGGEITQDTNKEQNLILFIFWGVFLPIMALAGLVGNILTIVVLWRKEMQSTTILYLRALVVTDTGILVGSVISLTPISYAQYYDGHLETFQNVIYPSFHTSLYYLVMSLQMMNVWITVSVSFERYIAICHPFRAARFITRRKTLVTMLVICIVSFLYNTPHLFATYAGSCVEPTLTPLTTPSSGMEVDYNISRVNSSLDYVTEANSMSSVQEVSGALMSNSSQHVHLVPLHTTPSVSTDTCLKVSDTSFGLSDGYKVYRSILYTLVIYLIPFSALLFLNGFLIKELMNMQRRRTANIQEENEANLSLVMVLIVIVFVICQTPGLISQFDVIPMGIFWTWLGVSNILFATNSAVNFLIYTAFGRKFRATLLRVGRRLCRSKRGRRGSTWGCSLRDTQLSQDYENSYPNETQYSSIKSTKSVASSIKSVFSTKSCSTKSGSVKSRNAKTGSVDNNEVGDQVIQLNVLTKTNNNGGSAVSNGVQGGVQNGEQSEVKVRETFAKKPSLPTTDEEHEEDVLSESVPLTVKNDENSPPVNGDVKT